MNRKLVLPVGLTIGALVVGLFICRWIRPCPTCPESPVVLGLEEGCPDDWDEVRLVFADRKVVSVGEQLGEAEAALGMISSGPQAQHNIPEYHDCQRFLAGGATPGARFDSLFAIFALAPDELLERLDSLDNHPVLAAQIWSYDGSYEELGIESWFNCLYLWRGDDGWEAVVAQPEPKNETCSDSLSTVPDNLQLTVLDTGYSTDSRDYPLAARWEWDADYPGYRIGIQCGLSWCEIARTRDDLAPIEDAASYAMRQSPNGIGDNGVTWSGDRLVRARVKGWYDEQILDIYTDGRLVSSGIRGWLFPDPEIGQLDTLDYKDTWVRSAFVFLEPLFDDVDAGLAKYEAMLNFGRTDWMNPNVVWFCRPVNGSCGVPQTVLDKCKVDVGDDTWLARIFNSEKDSEEYRCVARCDHWPADVPGTARWRGVEYDAKAWTRCAEGCCTIQ